MEEIKDYFLMERKLVRNMSPVERLIYLEFCERARWNGNVTNKLGVELDKGGFVFGLSELCERVGASMQKVRTALQNLTNNQQINIKQTTNRGSIGYLCRLGVILPKITSQQQTNNTQPCTNVPVPKPEPIKTKKECATSAPPSGTLRLFIETLNSVTGSKFSLSSKSTVNAFKAREAEFAPSEQQLVALVKVKAKQWLDDPKMAGHLNPTTLLRPANFERYLNEAQALIKSEEVLLEAYGD